MLQGCKSCRGQSTGQSAGFSGRERRSEVDVQPASDEVQVSVVGKGQRSRYSQ